MSYLKLPNRLYCCIKGSFFKIVKEVDYLAKKNKSWLFFLEVLRWLSLILAILFFLWLAKNLGWLG